MSYVFTLPARMPQVAKAERKERAQRLRDLGERQVERFLESRLGARAQVLIEKDGMGRTEHFAPVTLFGPVGAILSVPMTMIVRLSLEFSESTRGLAYLVSSGKHPFSSKLPEAENEVAP